MEFWVIEFVELVRCPQQDFLCIVVKILLYSALSAFFFQLLQKQLCQVPLTFCLNFVCLV